jgi:hypothetical protein
VSAAVATVSTAVPRRHERDEFAATALTPRSFGRILLRHEREEFAWRPAARRAVARLEVPIIEQHHTALLVGDVIWLTFTGRSRGRAQA